MQPYAPPPAPTPPPPAVAFVALALGLVGALVFPLLYLAAAFVLKRNDVVEGLQTLGLLGALVVLAAFVTSIVAIVRSSALKASLAPALGALALSLLAPFTGVAAGFMAIIFAGGGVHGRPFRVGGAARAARPAPGDAWPDPRVAPAVDHLPAEVRERLAARWLAAALDEHASVAAFARLSLDLIALGAPPALLAGAARAAGEEVEHARACFAVAAALGGRAVGPGEFPDAAAPGPRAVDLATLARDAWVDGCLGEGAAAELARRAAARCADPAVAAVLARIADEEAGHAALSWDIVAWCRAQGGEAVERALAAVRDAAVPLPADERDDDALVAWGWPAVGDGAAARRAVRECRWAGAR